MMEYLDNALPSLRRLAGLEKEIQTRQLDAAYGPKPAKIRVADIDAPLIPLNSQPDK